MHYRQNWQGILSICRKAGKLAMGLEPTKDAMYRGTVSGVLVASDASAKTRKEAAFYCGQADGRNKNTDVGRYRRHTLSTPPIHGTMLVGGDGAL